MTKAEMIEKIEALEEKINELEEEVMDLEAEKQEIHHHYHYHYKQYQQPYIPAPWPRYPTYPYITYTSSSGVWPGKITADTITVNNSDLNDISDDTNKFYQITA